IYNALDFFIQFFNHSFPLSVYSLTNQEANWVHFIHSAPFTASTAQKRGSIIFVVGKSPMDIMEPILL
ncbi:MAG: hypothetical protein KHX89_08915, partial [Streptococcus mitis]|nr:hypothetical protein [Streptococcus mitis]